MVIVHMLAKPIKGQIIFFAMREQVDFILMSQFFKILDSFSNGNFFADEGAIVRDLGLHPLCERCQLLGR